MPFPKLLVARFKNRLSDLGALLDEMPCECEDGVDTFCPVCDTRYHMRMLFQISDSMEVTE